MPRPTSLSMAAIVATVLTAGTLPGRLGDHVQTGVPEMAAPSAAGPGRGAQGYISASIIPADTFSVGASLSAGPDGRGYGFGLAANGINDAYNAATAGDASFDFCFFVFSNNNSQPQTISFSVVSPSGSVIYKYGYKPGVIARTGNWYTVITTGDYKAVGTYFAEVHDGSSLVGWMPLNFVRS